MTTASEMLTDLSEYPQDGLSQIENNKKNELSKKTDEELEFRKNGAFERKRADISFRRPSAILIEITIQRCKNIETTARNVS